MSSRGWIKWYIVWSCLITLTQKKTLNEKRRYLIQQLTSVLSLALRLGRPGMVATCYFLIMLQKSEQEEICYLYLHDIIVVVNWKMVGRYIACWLMVNHPKQEWRPSHTTTETAKKVVIVHTHYNFFSQLQQFFQQFYIWTTIFTTIFSEKSLWKSLYCARALKEQLTKNWTRWHMCRTHSQFYSNLWTALYLSYIWLSKYYTVSRSFHSNKPSMWQSMKKTEELWECEIGFRDTISHIRKGGFIAGGTTLLQKVHWPKTVFI